MSYFVAPLSKLIEEFNKLPSIGKKSAQRLAFYILSQDMSYAENFASVLLEAKEKIKYCEICKNITDKEICSICSDETRDKSKICVVESPKDVLAMENLREYKGVYHVLHGVIDPLNEISPDDIYIKELLARVSDNSVNEIILANNASVEGETTAMYIAKITELFVSNITRLANGLPVGGDIEYADQGTLLRALEGRRRVNG